MLYTIIIVCLKFTVKLRVWHSVHHAAHGPNITHYISTNHSSSCMCQTLNRQLLCGACRGSGGWGLQPRGVKDQRVRLEAHHVLCQLCHRICGKARPNQGAMSHGAEQNAIDFKPLLVSEISRWLGGLLSGGNITRFETSSNIQLRVEHSTTTAEESQTASKKFKPR